ncbi:hypothetical protein [Streptomyces boninensis]|uniref:hypothetical protein n=1 Tax=Streptomyces boninensis TaxID=2039455 RepID=UPI003B21FB6F
MDGTSRDPRLQLVPRQPTREIAASARRAVRHRTRRQPRVPDGIAPRVRLAAQARELLAGAVRVARWAESGRMPSRSAAGAESAPAPSRKAAEAAFGGADAGRDWDFALLTGLIELHGERARPGWRLRAWDRDDSAVLRGWVALFDAWSFARPAADDADPAAVAEVVVATPQVLALLHLSGGPMRVPALLDLLRQRVAELRDGAPGASDTDDELPALLGWTLTALAGVGALTLDAERREAALTPLGHWAVWTKLEQICVAAQSPAGGNIEQPAPEMLRGCAGLSPGPARAEYRAWLAARPTGGAVTELLESARGDDALVRGLAFEALRVVGAPAASAVRAACGEAVLRPYAVLWLAEQEGADPEDAPEALTRREATWLWLDTAAAVADHGEAPLLVSHLDAAVQGNVPELLREVREAGHPRTVQVLVALAAAHPDPALAKAVRRAAFEVHTGGA